MDLYEAIFVRKSVRKYSFEKIDDQKLDEIRKHYQSLFSLFGRIASDIAIIDNTKKQFFGSGFLSVQAPYYIVFYTEDLPRNLMNVGYMMQEMSLFLTTMGLGSCMLGHTRVKKGLNNKNGLQIAGLMAFGEAKGKATRRHSEARRLSIDDLCVFKEMPRQWVKQLLEAARLAPSYMNTQPWRFVVYDHKIHIFSRKSKKVSRWEEINFGIMFANIMIAAEELWLDVDLIRLEEITQKQLPNNRYVLSAVLKD